MAGRKRKRCRPDPHGCVKRIEQVHSRAKENALQLLIRTLQTRTEEADELVQSLRNALGLQDTAHLDADAGAEHKHEEAEGQDDQREVASETSDQHNEVCEVCEKGGKLLCCDTCSLVFHLGCVRPKLEKLPRGKWSCAYCVADSVAKGDKEAAKRAVATMKSMSVRSTKKNGVVMAEGAADSDDLAAAGGRGNAADTSSVVIVRSGRRFILKEKLATLGKYDTLDQAIMAYREHTGQLPPRDASGNDDELWCSYCLDDKSIEVCAFCGCKKCFGKHDTENLLLCDGCDSEYHIYCLEPALSAVPGGRWFCNACLNRSSESDSEQIMEFDRRSAAHSESVDEVGRESLESTFHGDESCEHTDSMNGFGNGDVNESNMSYSSAHQASPNSDSEESASHATGEPKRIKLPADLPTVSTSYDLASVVQLSAHMSSRLLEADELAQLASVCSAAVPDHLHTLLDALHQQKHLILKKLDKEESLARKQAGGKDGSPVSSAEEEEDDGTAASTASSPSSRNDEDAASGVHDFETKDEDSSSPRAPTKRQSRSSTACKVEKLRGATESRQSPVEDKSSDTSRHSKQARKVDKNANRKQPTVRSSEVKDAKTTKSAAASTTVASKPSNGEATALRASNGVDTSQPKKQARTSGPEKPVLSGNSMKNGGRTTPTSSTTRTAPATGADPTAMSMDALRSHALAASAGKFDGLPGMPHLHPLSLSQLTSGLTTDQMLQLMGSDMLLAQHQFPALSSLGFGNSFLDYSRHHALATAGLPAVPNIPLPDFATGATTDGNGGALTQMLRELNQRQLTGKPLRPVQDDLLVATLAAALSGNSNTHYHTPDMYSSLAQANMRWLHEAQTPRSTSTEASAAEPKSSEPTKLSRKYPVKQK